MPVFNGASLLRSAIKSILTQSYSNIEVIVCDNASTDETETICREFVEQDRRVRYSRNMMNLGAPANFLNTLVQSKGRYFMWASHDDSWNSNYVALLVGKLEKQSEAILATGRAIFLDQAGRCREDWRDSFASVGGRPWISLLRGHASHWIYGLFCREYLERTAPSLLAQRYPWGGDMVWLLRVVSSEVVTGTDDAIIYKTIKPSPYRPRGARNVVAWQLWYGQSLAVATIESRLPVFAKLPALIEVLNYWIRYLRQEGDMMLARTWLAAIRDTVMRRKSDHDGSNK